MKALIKIQYVDSVAKNPRAAKMIDSVSNVWSQYDDMGETSLGAVVVRGRPHIRMDTPSAPAPTRLTVAAPSQPPFPAARF